MVVDSLSTYLREKIFSYLHFGEFCAPHPTSFRRLRSWEGARHKKTAKVQVRDTQAGDSLTNCMKEDCQFRAIISKEISQFGVVQLALHGISICRPEIDVHPPQTYWDRI